MHVSTGHKNELCPSRKISGVLTQLARNRSETAGELWKVEICRSLVNMIFTSMFLSIDYRLIGLVITKYAPRNYEINTQQLRCNHFVISTYLPRNYEIRRVDFLSLVLLGFRTYFILEQYL